MSVFLYPWADKLREWKLNSVKSARRKGEWMRQYCNSEGVRSSKDSCQFICEVLKNVKCWFQLGGNSIEDSKKEAKKQIRWAKNQTAFHILGCLISWSIIQQWKQTQIHWMCFLCLIVLAWVNLCVEVLWIFFPCLCMVSCDGLWWINTKQDQVLSEHQWLN